MTNQITPDHIKLTLAKSKGKGYIILNLSYGFKVRSGDKTTYRPVKVSSGLSFDPEHWTKDGPSLEWIKSNKKKYVTFSTQLDEVKTLLADSFNQLVQELGGLPTPEQVMDRFKNGRDEASDNTTYISLVDFIDQVAIPDAKSKRTKQKFETVKTLLQALQEARSTLPFSQWATKKGVFYVQNFDQKDWQDLTTFITKASCSISSTYTKYGLQSLTYDGGYYNQVTAEMFQRTVIGFLYKAQKKGFKLNTDPSHFDKFQRPSKSQESLSPKHLKALIEARFDSPHLENTRQLMVIGCLMGLRDGDYQTILNKDIITIEGDNRTFKAISYQQQKTGQHVLCPLMQPVIDILEGDNKPHSIVNQDFNRYCKKVAQKLGFNDFHIEINAKADGTKDNQEGQLWKFISTHTFRRTAYTLFALKFNMNDLLVTKAITGHRNKKEVHQGYEALSPQQAAETLLDFVELQQDRVGLQLVNKTKPQTLEVA